MKAAVAALLLFASTTHAGIRLDVEPDPLPLVEITVVVPAGIASSNPQESGAASLMPDILEAGTTTMEREAFLDRLASFGATSNFTLSNLYSVWTLRFPIVEGKDYAALGRLLAENWNSPRITDDTFEIALRKLKAALEAGLDSDMSLGVTTTRRWLDRHAFGNYPVTLDGVAALRRETVAEVWARDFVSAKQIWAGVVAPRSSLPLVRSLLSSVFAAQGEIVEGGAPQPLPLRTVSPERLRSEHVFLILDKPDRTQTMTSVIGVSPHRYSTAEELAADFGNHVLVNGRLGSIFGDEIRTKRGLAYSVSGVQPYFLGYPSLGLATNPVRPRTDEALGVIANLLGTGYGQPTLIRDLPEEAWNRQWQSYLYARMLERSSPEGRIGERMQVAVGEFSPELYLRDTTEWKTDRTEVSQTLSKTWTGSIVVGAVVGDAKELRPMIARHFPKHRVVVIPYREAILSKTYRETR